MSKSTRSARGQIVDFDLLSIKQQLATAPVPVGVNERRRFIDEKDGIRTKQVQEPEISSALLIAQEGIAESEAAVEDEEE